MKAVLRRYAPYFGVLSLLAFAAVALTFAAPQAKETSFREEESDDDARAGAHFDGGQWMLEPSKESGKVNLTLHVEFGSYSQHWGSDDVDFSTLVGLDPDWSTRGRGDVAFEIRRDAGTIVCEGKAARNRAAGVFDIQLSKTFAQELERRGIGEPSEKQQIQLVLADAGLDLLDDLDRLGFDKPSIQSFVKMAQHGVNHDFVDGLSDAGYKFESIEDLIEARDHGVTPKYLKELGELGFKNLPFETARRARDHGVTVQYAREMNEIGGQKFELAELIELRDHGVTGDYVKSMAAAGFKDATLEELRVARDHGVSGSYLQGMMKAGYKGATLDDFREARDHGVSPEYAADWKEAGYTLTLRQLIRARDHGVDAAFAERMNKKSGEKNPIDDVIRARDTGYYR